MASRVRSDIKLNLGVQVKAETFPHVLMDGDLTFADDAHGAKRRNLTKEGITSSPTTAEGKSSGIADAVRD